MPVTQEDIRNAIEEAEREIAELKAAYRVMERLGGADIKSNTTADSVMDATIGETGVIDLDEIELTSKPAKVGPTLVTDIRILIGRLGSQEFTVNHVHAILRKMGKGSKAKHFKNRISVTIRKLVDEGLITRTHEGSGNDPHKYRVAKDGGLEKTQARISPKGEPEPRAGLGSLDQQPTGMAAARTARKVGGT